MDEVQRLACPLVDHVGIKALRPELGHPVSESLPLRPHRRESRFELCDLAIDSCAPYETELAIERVKSKIAEQHDGNCRHDKSLPDSLLALTSGTEGHDTRNLKETSSIDLPSLSDQA